MCGKELDQSHVVKIYRDESFPIKKLIVLRGLISSALKSKFMKSPEHRSNDKYRISSNRRELNENSDQNPRSSSFQYRKQLVLDGNIHGIYNYR